MISTGGHLTILESVDSTNNYAMARLRTGLAKHGDAFFARAQVNGKGQRGKTWVTERGTNIIITLVMQPPGLQLHQQFVLSAAVALAAREFFAGYAGEETFIKWPNDIYWRDRKAGGILIESIIGSQESLVENQNTQTKNQGVIMKGLPTTDSRLPIAGSRLSTDPWRWAIIGIGININQTVFPENIRNAVSLKQITGKDHDVIELAKDLCTHVQTRYEQLQAGKDLIQEYNNHLYKKDQPVTLKKGNRLFEATVKEVNNSGDLIVFTALEERFAFGEIEWILK